MAVVLKDKEHPLDRPMFYEQVVNSAEDDNQKFMRILLRYVDLTPTYSLAQTILNDVEKFFGPELEVKVSFPGSAGMLFEALGRKFLLFASVVTDVTEGGAVHIGDRPVVAGADQAPGEPIPPGPLNGQSTASRVNAAKQEEDAKARRSAFSGVKQPEDKKEGQ